MQVHICILGGECERGCVSLGTSLQAPKEKNNLWRQSTRQANCSTSQIPNSDLILPSCLGTHSAPIWHLPGFLWMATRETEVPPFGLTLTFLFLPWYHLQDDKAFILSNYSVGPFLSASTLSLWLWDKAYWERVVKLRSKDSKVSEVPDSFPASRVSLSQGKNPAMLFPGSHSNLMKVLIIFSPWNLSTHSNHFGMKMKGKPQATRQIRGQIFNCTALSTPLRVQRNPMARPAFITFILLHDKPWGSLVFSASLLEGSRV